MTRLVTCLVVAGLAMSAILSMLEWRRAKSMLRVELAETATRSAHDLGRVLPLIHPDDEHAAAMAEELLRVHAAKYPVVGARLLPHTGVAVSWGAWPRRDEVVQRMVLHADGRLSSEAIDLDRPLILDVASPHGRLSLIVDSAGAAAKQRSELLERLAVQWLLVAVLTLVVLLLIRRWVGEPLADLSGLLGASASADTLASLAAEHTGDVGRLAGEMANLLRRLESQNRELGRREREFTDLFERAPAAMITLDLDGIITQANAAAGRLVDDGDVPLVRRRVIDLVQVEDRPLLAEVLARLTYNDTARCRLRLRPGLGRAAIETSLEAMAVRDADGELESVRVSIADVSGPARVREQLLERAELLRVALDHVPEAVVMVDEQARVITANRPMLALLRRDRVTLEGGARLDDGIFWDGMSLADPAGWAERVRQIHAQPHRTVQERLPTLGGAMLVRSSPVADAATGLRGRLWLLQDATGDERRERTKGQQKRGLAALRGVGEALGDVRDVDALLERSAAALRDALRVDTVGIAIRSQHATQRTRQMIHTGQSATLLAPAQQLVDAVARELFPRLGAQQDLLHWPDLDTGEAKWAGGFRGVGLTSLVACPIASGRQMHGIVWAAQRAGGRLAHDTLDLLETLCPLLAVRLEAVQLSQRLQGLHLVDPVTELPSVLQFERAMHTLLGRPGEIASMLVFDLDRFDEINAAHGRAAGDAVLRQVASRLLAANRRNGFIARFAGPGFGVILTGADREQAAKAAERLRAVIADTPLTLPGGATARVTASVGVGCWPSDGLRVDEIFDLALCRLQAAKLGGRDRVVAEGPAALLQAG